MQKKVVPFHANDCFVIDSKAPGAFTGCAWDVDQSETRGPVVV